MLEKEEAYMALDLVTPFTKVQLEEEIKDTGRKQVGILGGNFNPVHNAHLVVCLLYTSPSPRDVEESRMPSSA